MTRKEEQRAQWAITRQKGKARFILLRGVLGWGLTTAILYSLVLWLVLDTDIKMLLPISLVIFPMGGLLWGWSMWHFHERLFKKNTE